MSIMFWLCVPLLLLAAGWLFQFIDSAVDRRRYPAPGRLVTVNGVRIHAYSQSDGEPAVILESGIAASSLNWRMLQVELAQFTRVISYDRAGFAWSEAARTPRTVANLASELEGMISALGVTGPMILVSHSFGSLILREYCHRNSSRAAGMVLLAPIDCEHWRSLSSEGKERLVIGAKFSRRGAWLARFGIVRLSLMLLAAGARTLPKRIARAASGSGETVISRIAGEVAKLPHEVWPAVRAHWSRPQSFQTMAQYLSQLRSCVDEVPYNSLGDLPLIVISGEDAGASELNEHRKLAALSTRGVHIIAEKSGHWVHLDRPDLVVRCVQKLLQQPREFVRG